TERLLTLHRGVAVQIPPACACTVKVGERIVNNSVSPTLIPPNCGFQFVGDSGNQAGCSHLSSPSCPFVVECCRCTLLNGITGCVEIEHARHLRSQTVARER